MHLLQRIVRGLREEEWLGRLSILRTFINVIAGTGACFAALHVLIGYIDFDGELNEVTGDTPKFFDQEEYRYYLLLACFFALTILVSAVLRRFPEMAMVPALATSTYVMLLFDEGLLTAGKMTFLVFSLFVFLGHTALAFHWDECYNEHRARRIACLFGALIGVLAVTVYFRAPKAAEEILVALRPDADIEGEAAARAYRRLDLLAELFEAEHHMAYFRVGLLQIITALVIYFFPRRRLIGRVLSIGAFGYTVVQFFAENLGYFPMLYVMPIVLVFFAYQTFFSGTAFLSALHSAPAASAERVDLSSLDEMAPYESSGEEGTEIGKRKRDEA